MGFEFLFIHALWALPLAGLPILLHLLFRRKSPVVMFSTLRFIKASIQHTAARRKVQRWLLLACRALLLLLLIWAVAQPARILAQGWFTGQSTIAAIVVDTSYSMLYQEQQVSLLDRASSTVEELLRGQLAEARVAIFRSQPAPADQPEQLQSARQLLTNWTPLTPQPATQPLTQRINAAIELLKNQEASQKWLIIISDLQTREFPQPLSRLEGLRVALIDLQPAQPRWAGITRVEMIPRQPIAGITSDVLIDVTGHAGDSRAISLSVESVDGQVLKQFPPTVVRFDAGGHAQERIPVVLPVQRWMKLRASLQSDDPMSWDNTRSLLVEMAPRQNVFIVDPGQTLALPQRFVQLALDPNEGKQTDWPLMVQSGSKPQGQADVIVELWNQWPDQSHTDNLRSFVDRGGTIMLFLQPGLEQSWPALNDHLRQSLLELLPGEPIIAPVKPAPYSAQSATNNDPLLQGISLDAGSLGRLLVRRWVAMIPNDPNVTVLLRLTSPQTGTADSPPLLARRNAGAGRVFTWSTLPQNQFTNLALHPVFMQMLVSTALAPANQSTAQNIEIGQQLQLPPRRADGATQLDLEGPNQQITRVSLSQSGGGQFFRSPPTVLAGSYRWRHGEKVIAMAQVELPAGEAEIAYRNAEQITNPADHIVVARSLAEMATKITQISEPSPRWTWAIALVLLLMCAEALMGSISHLWKPIRLGRFFSPVPKASRSTESN